MAKRGKQQRKQRGRQMQSANIDLEYNVEMPSPYGNRPDIVTVNKRSDTLTWLWRNGHIDDCQKMAGDRFQRLLHKLGSKGARAMDYTNEPVDGGGAWPEVDVHAIEAAKEVTLLANEIGMKDYNIMRHIIGGGLTFQQLAKMWPRRKSERAEAEYLGSRFRDALDIAAKHWR